MSTGTSREDFQRTHREPLSQEDTRGLVKQLRSAPAEQIITDVFSTLLSTAQVKLGRRDARLFIDLCALTLDHAGPHLSAELGTQVENALGQLRLGQVSAEKELAKHGDPESNDLSRIPTPPTTSGRSASSGGQETSPSSRPRVPGR